MDQKSRDGVDRGQGPGGGVRRSGQHHSCDGMGQDEVVNTLKQMVGTRRMHALAKKVAWRMIIRCMSCNGSCVEEESSSGRNT